MTARTLEAAAAVARRRRRAGGFDARRLYMAGEASLWYDPSDLTAEKVAWRRNLWLYSEPTSATGYTVGNVTFTTNALFSFLPGGGACIELADATVWRYVRQFPTLTAGVTYTLSFYVTIAGGGLPNSGSGSYRDFTITRDNQDVTNYALITYDDLGGGVYRAKHTWLHTGASPTIQITKYNGLNTNTAVRFTGLQLEASATATAYQRITDFTSDFLAAFPTHALYQDSAGTTPVTALGQPVGLALDTSRGGLANVGAELFTNPNCTSLTGFVAGGSNPPTLTFSGGVRGAQTVDDGAGRIETTTITGFVIGRMYMVEVTAINACTKGNLAASGFTWGTIADNNFALGTTTKRIFVTATATSGVCRYYLGNTADNDGNVATITRHSVREVPGVHAIQPTSASRPLLDGRVNLLTFSEQFDNAAWTLANPGTRTANTDVAPDGTTTADTITDNITGNYTSVRQTITIPNGTQSYVCSAHFKKTTSATSFPGASMILSGGTAKAASVAINTDTGIAVARTGEVPDSIEVRDAGAYWRLLWTVSNNGTGNTSIQSDIYAAVNTNGGATWVATTQGSAVIWGADLRLAADAAYPYQRVAAATDYADVGVPRSFLFDGFDDSLYTASNMDLSGTDKVTVLAGVRKLSDGAAGMLAETSASANVQNGSFFIAVPDNIGALGDFGICIRGTTVGYLSSGVVLAPVTRVLSLLSSISAPSRELRLNAVQVAASALSLGTGNFGSHVLFIGRRNNASIPFNGKAYQLIVRGALTDAATLVQAERFVAQRTGITL